MDSQAPDESFIALACSWMMSPATLFLDIVWRAYDDIVGSPFNPNPSDLERSVTQLVEPRIRKVMSGDEPFYIQHEPYERETMMSPPAQPPQYDLAFVFYSNPRVMWPIEAKVLETPGRVANYSQDIRANFLTCRYAPFSNSGAMLGYLLAGTPSDAFLHIGASLDTSLYTVPEQSVKPNRRSSHMRSVPNGKPYPADFDIYHLIFALHELHRASKAARGEKEITL